MQKHKLSFYKALRDLSVNKKNFKDEWEYGGGRVCPCKHDCSHTEKHHNYYCQRFSHIKMPKYKKICICKHPIVENCFLYNVIKKKMIVVGNCCITRYMKKQKGKKCLTCKKTHRNRKEPWCNDCRELKINFGMYKEKGYRYIDFYQNHIDDGYQRWCIRQNALATEDSPLKQFSDWLILTEKNK